MHFNIQQIKLKVKYENNAIGINKIASNPSSNPTTMINIMQNNNTAVIKIHLIKVLIGYIIFLPALSFSFCHLYHFPSLSL